MWENIRFLEEIKFPITELLGKIVLFFTIYKSNSCSLWKIQSIKVSKDKDVTQNWAGGSHVQGQPQKTTKTLSKKTLKNNI